MEPGPEARRSPVISRPQDEESVAKLERKYQEYLGRIGEATAHPEQSILLGLATGNDGPLDAYIKSSVLRRVLDDGEVIVWDWAKSFLTEDPIISRFSDDLTSLTVSRTAEACGIIDAYCKGDLSQLTGGTGLN